MAVNVRRHPATAMDTRKTLILLAFASALPAIGGTVAIP